MFSKSHKLFSLVLVLSALQLKDIDGIEISSYARVSKNGDSISIKSDSLSGGNDRTITSNMSHIESTLIDK